VPSVAVPACRVHLVPVAAVVVRANVTVCCPPLPLQCARFAAQTRRNDVAKLAVCISARWQVVALWVPNINRLAVCPGIIRNAIRWGLCTNQSPRIGAVITHCSVADLHLRVTEMMCCDGDLKLGNLSSRVSRTDGTFAVSSRTPISCPPSIHAIVIPRASQRHVQVAVTLRACITGCEEQSHQSTATMHGCHGLCG